jgi:hypothetical protein
MTDPSATGDVLQHSVAITNIQTAPRPFDIATHCFQSEFPKQSLQRLAAVTSDMGD